MLLAERSDDDIILHNIQWCMDKIEHGGEKSRRNSRKMLHLGQAQKWRCMYCQVLTDAAASRHLKKRLPTLDHVIPKSKGGGGGLSNLVLACLGCNTTKGDNTEFAHFDFVVPKKPRIKNGKVIEGRSTYLRREVVDGRWVWVKC